MTWRHLEVVGYAGVDGVDVHQGGEAEEEGGIVDPVQHRGHLLHLLDTLAAPPHTTLYELDLPYGFQEDRHHLPEPTVDSSRVVGHLCRAEGLRPEHAILLLSLHHLWKHWLLVVMW